MLLSHWRHPHVAVSLETPAPAVSSVQMQSSVACHFDLTCYHNQLWGSCYGHCLLDTAQSPAEQKQEVVQQP